MERKIYVEPILKIRELELSTKLLASSAEGLDPYTGRELENDD